MKVAVLFTGNIRSFDQCKQNFIEKLSFLNPDYYVTTYDTRYNFRTYVNFHNDVNLSDDEIVNFFSGMNVKAIEIDNLAKMLEYFNSEKQKFDSSMTECEQNHFLQFYKFKKGLDLVSNYEKITDTKYDVLIRARLDLIMKDINHLDLSNLENTLINGWEIYSKWTASPTSDEKKVWNDFFMISTLDNMHKIIDNLLSEFYKKTHQKSPYAFPHGVFEAGIVKSNLKVENVDILHRIIRYGDITEFVQ
jgi:hypothetical protein